MTLDHPRSLDPDPVVRPGRMRGTEQPTLTGDSGLLLRPFRNADTGAVARAYQDPDVRFWNFRRIDDEADAARWIEHQREGWAAETVASWAIANKRTLLGRIALNNVKLTFGVAEVGYWMLPEARGRGAAGTALAMVTEWALHELGLHRINLYHSIANPASCRVAEKAAYALDGTARSAWPHPDGWHDMHLHGAVNTNR